MAAIGFEAVCEYFVAERRNARRMDDEIVMNSESKKGPDFHDEIR